MNGFFIQTIQLPQGMTAMSELYGPSVGDPPVTEDEVYYAKRPPRGYPSRMIRKPTRPVDKVTVIAGPRNGRNEIYTMFGGNLGEKEPNDRSLTPSERPKAIAFWSQHALAP